MENEWYVISEGGRPTTIVQGRRKACDLLTENYTLTEMEKRELGKFLEGGSPLYGQVVLLVGYYEANARKPDRTLTHVRMA